MQLDELPDELITEITNYLSNSKTVMNLLVTSRLFYDFLYDLNGSIYHHYGYCCKNVRYKCNSFRYLNKCRHFVGNVDIDFDQNDIIIDVNKFENCIKNVKIQENCSIEGLPLIYNAYEIECKSIIDDYILSENFIEVNELHISFNDKITDDGIEYLKNIKKIFLNYCTNITNKSLRTLKNVHTLGISDCYNITNEGLKYLENVKKLVIEGKLAFTAFTDDGLKYLGCIHTLIIKNCRMCGYVSDMIKGFGFRYLKNVYELDISNRGKTTKDIILSYLVETNIQALNISNSYTTDEGLKYLSKIKFLNISNCRKITDNGMKYLSHLHSLDISKNRNITNDSLVHLKRIHTLNVSFCKNISELFHLQNIHTLRVKGCNISKEMKMKYLRNVKVLFS